MSLPPVKGFLETSLLDWEGKLAAVVFLPGCNFRCGYCHAAHLISEAARLESIPIEQVTDSLNRNRDWIDGIVISGGEPTLHKGLRELIELFRGAGLAVKLDTNGSRPGVLDELLEDKLVDHVAMDAKAPLDERYSEVAGVPVALDDIRASVEMLIRSDVSYEFRTTVCPAFLDADDVVDTAEVVRGAADYFLQKFRPVGCLDPALEEVKPYNDDEMRRLAVLAAKFVRRCQVRGDAGSQTAHKRASRATS